MGLNKSFLVVDDSAMMRQLILMTLKKMGCTSVVDASNGRVALEKLLTHRIDIVLTDIDMPEMNGLEFIERARAQCRAVDARRQLVVGYTVEVSSRLPFATTAPLLEEKRDPCLSTLVAKRNTTPSAKQESVVCSWRPSVGGGLRRW